MWESINAVMRLMSSESCAFMLRRKESSGASFRDLSFAEDASWWDLKSDLELCHHARHHICMSGSGL